eukprot:SAG11_NODE_4735_length_1787_cov_1.344194_2_plen_246_part_00
MLLWLVEYLVRAVIVTLTRRVCSGFAVVELGQTRTPSQILALLLSELKTVTPWNESLCRLSTGPLSSLCSACSLEEVGCESVALPAAIDPAAGSGILIGALAAQLAGAALRGIIAATRAVRTQGVLSDGGRAGEQAGLEWLEVRARSLIALANEGVAPVDQHTEHGWGHECQHAESAGGEVTGPCAAECGRQRDVLRAVLRWLQCVLSAAAAGLVALDRDSFSCTWCGYFCYALLRGTFQWNIPI